MTSLHDDSHAIPTRFGFFRKQLKLTMSSAMELKLLSYSTYIKALFPENPLKEARLIRSLTNAVCSVCV